MAEVFEDARADGPGMPAAEQALARGLLVVVPTDTVYGVAARPELPEATDRVFRAKGRPRALTLPVLVASVGDAERVAALDERALGLAVRFWPGPLTIVVPRRGASWGWDLGAEHDTVGIRVPDHEVALALLQRTGPLAVTSANQSGRPTPMTCAGVRDVFGDHVAVYLCSGPSSNAASTVVDVAGPEPRILREGAVPAADVLEAATQP